MSKKTKEMPEYMKKILVVLGVVSLLLGIIGIVVPLLPTTPFLLLAAACFIRGSDRLHNWLMNHKIFGSYIRNYREHKAIPLKTKVVALALLWATILFSVIFVLETLWLRILLGTIAVAITAHILHFRTLK